MLTRSEVRFGAIAAVLVVLAGCGGEDRGASGSVRFGFSNNGVTDGVGTPDGLARLIAEAGGEVDRVQISWAALEPAEGDRRFDPYDRIYAADLRQGVRPLFIFAFAPEWAAAVPCASAPQPCHAPPSAAHYADAARTVAEIAQRYPKAAGIEIWNEPNAPYFWAPKPDPVAYGELLSKTYRAVKRVDPAMPVAGGSTSSSPGFVAGHIQAPDFVAALREEGALRHMDALSVHAYPEQADSSAQSAVAHLESVRTAMGPAAKPIWVTETGASTSGPQALTPEGQGLTISRLVEALPEVSGVSMVLIHTLVEPPRDPRTPEPGFGVVLPSLAPKPAYSALTDAWRDA